MEPQINADERGFIVLRITIDKIRTIYEHKYNAINLAIDIVLVSTGFFGMTLTQYLTDIGLRYLSMPIYTICLGYAL
jgi:hypothetical protein